MDVAIQNVDDDQPSMESIILADPDLKGFWRRIEDGSIVTLAGRGFGADRDFGAVGTVGELGFKDSFTASAWINLNSLERANTIFGTNRVDLNQGLHLGVRNGRVEMGFLGNEIGCSDCPAMVSGRWYQVVVRNDAGKQTQTVFLDGQPIGQVTSHHVFDIPVNDVVYLGRSAKGHRFDGLIDEAFVIGRALKNEEIARLYDNRQAPVFEPAEVANKNAKPLVTMRPVTSLAESGTTTLNGIFSDLSSLNDRTMVIDWGDSSTATFDLGTIFKIAAVRGSTVAATTAGLVGSSTDSSILTVDDQNTETGEVCFSVKYHYLDRGTTGVAGAINVMIHDETGSVTKIATIEPNIGRDEAPVPIQTIESGKGKYGNLVPDGRDSHNYALIDDKEDVLNAERRKSDSYTYVLDGPEDSDIASSSGERAETAGDDVINPRFTVRGVVAGHQASVTKGNVGVKVRGAYGDLILHADGSYDYELVDLLVEGLDQDDVVSDVFTYLTEEGSGATAIDTMAITVNGTSDVPIVNSETDSDSVDESVSVTNVAFSGTAYTGAGAADESALVKNGSYGTLSIDADGSYTYSLIDEAVESLGSSETRIESFIYTIKDCNGGSDTANLTITVTGANDEVAAGETALKGAEKEGVNSASEVDLTVSHIGPTIHIDPVPFDVEGLPITLRGSFSDSRILDKHTIEIEWGDGARSTVLLPPVGVLNEGDSFVSNTDGAIFIIESADPISGEVEFRVPHTYAEAGEVIATTTLSNSHGDAVKNTQGGEIKSSALPLQGIMTSLKENQIDRFFAGFWFFGDAPREHRPFFGGKGMPGATVKITLRDEVGIIAGQQTDVVDTKGIWKVTLPAAVQLDATYQVTIEMVPSTWNESAGHSERVVRQAFFSADIVSLPADIAKLKGVLGLIVPCTEV